MKNWIKKTLLSLCTILLIIASINFFIDPYWTFNHNNKYNSIQRGTNERQQKANYIYFTSKTYNAVLLGSSRTTYMNRHSFSNMNVFNFSATAMRPQEYITYIDFVIDNAKQPIDTIILGMDFFGYLDYGLFKFDNAPSIVSNTKSFLYRWKLLLSFDALNTSFKNIRDTLKNKTEDNYDRDEVKHRKVKKVNIESFKKYVMKDAKIYTREEYSSKPNINFKEIISHIKEKYNNKKIIVYTTPVSQPLFDEMIKSGHLNDYKDWLRDLINTFGEVHHFMYPNIISQNYWKYFADSNHVYPRTNHILAQQIITNYTFQKIDFGILLNKQNIEEFLNSI